MKQINQLKVENLELKKMLNFQHKSRSSKNVSVNHRHYDLQSIQSANSDR